jgi:hypothetical protein
MKTILLKKKNILSVIILIFCASQNVKAQNESSVNAEAMQSFQLEFKSVDGPTVNRELLLSFSENTSDNFDEGYDTKNLQLLQDDLNLMLNGEFFTSQAYSPIAEDKVVPLVFQASGSYTYTIELTGSENLGDQNVELKDNLLDISFGLRNGQAYTFTSEEGYFPGRFQLTFKTTTLSQTKLELESVNFYYANNIDAIIVSNPQKVKVKSVEMFDMLGKKVYSNQDKKNQTAVRYPIRNLNTGIYIIRLVTENNAFLSKKIMIQ